MKKESGQYGQRLFWLGVRSHQEATMTEPFKRALCIMTDRTIQEIVVPACWEQADVFAFLRRTQMPELFPDPAQIVSVSLSAHSQD